MKASPNAGNPVEASMLVNVPRLITAYYAEMPDPSAPEQRVAFGTSGHRGSSFEKAFNERHILAISQAICLYREQKKIAGPLFLGMDTHALSVPALASALEVLAANGVEVMIAQGAESFRGADHLRRILEEAQAIVDNTLAAAPDRTQEPENEGVESWRNEGNPN
jgi:phosphoglucomutase